MALEQRKTLSELTPSEWEHSLGRKLSKKTLASITKTLDLRKHVEGYRTKGSPNPRQTATMILSQARLIHLMFEDDAYANAKLKRSLKKLSSVGRQFTS